MVKVFKRKNQLLFVVETLACFVAVAIPLMVRYHDRTVFELRFAEDFGFKSVLYTVILVTSIFLNDLYNIRVLTDRRTLLPQLAKSSLVAAILYAVFAAAVPEAAQGRVVFGLSLLFVNLLFLLQYKLFGRTLRNRVLHERVLVLGTGTLGKTIRDELRSGDYRQALIRDPDVERKVLEAVHRLGSEMQLRPKEERTLREEVDVIVLAFENQGWPERLSVRESRGKLKLLNEGGNVVQMATYRPGPAPYPYSMDTLARGLTTLKLGGIQILAGLDYYEQIAGRVFLGEPADPLFFSQASFRIDKLTFILKDFWERMIAFVLLLVTLPFMVLVPLAVFLESGRPLLFVQERVGRCGKKYNLFKWRSMTADGKVTRVGHIIRKTKLDELPQLFNVLRGEMSLVGPRPEMPGFVRDFQIADGYYNLRLMVKPGLTGWAQVMFPNARAEDAIIKLSYDLYYVKNFSLVSDMVIMLETFKMIVFGGVAHIERSPLAGEVTGGARGALPAAPRSRPTT